VDDVDSGLVANSVTARDRPSQVAIAVYLLYARVVSTAIRAFYQGSPTWVGFKIPKLTLVLVWFLFGVPFGVRSQAVSIPRMEHTYA
jgi:hypothetical protein